MKKMVIYFLNLCLILAPLVSGDSNRDLCQTCECQQTEVKLLINCKLHVNWENIEWPAKFEDDSIELRSSHDAKMSTVLTFPYNEHLKTLNITGNEIRTIAPGAFKQLPNLQVLFLSNNSLRHLAADMLQGLLRLKSLDLSLNRLTEIHGDVLTDLRGLENLSLAGNEFVKIPNEVMSNLPSLQTLDISNNSIFILKLMAPNLPNLRVINLSRNNLTVITADTFTGLPMLEHIDLSRNNIVRIESKSFEISSLRLLDLSHNKLSERIILPADISWASFKANKFVDWPLDEDSHKQGLVYLNVEDNNLREVKIDEDYENLETLLLGGNALIEYPDVRLPKLTILNLGRNNFMEIPAQLNSEVFPKLKYLTLSANPMSVIKFEKILSLEKLTIDDMPHLTKINGLENIQGGKLSTSSNGPCLDLSIANCKQLDQIQDDAFENLNLCRLNLSHNALTRVPLSAPRGVELDLQGNPLVCSCALQWVLDELLPSLYDIYPRVLRDLRCDGHRLVRWYRWKNRPLCKGDRGSGEENADLTDLTRASSKEPMLTSSTGFYIVAGCSLAVLISLIAVGMYHTKVQRNKYKAVKRNRRLQA